ncbi:MAG: hypothetical protein Q8927_02370 [Bacteroidota bacterium]|nr:hypothetical protein [Bacteroidota bacterium]MDP4215017.1 hypothetical protein [Bacteroidota bacterium]MDP4244235.1 hypothetical protein [Bacteroidota bacterium]MDP4255950.1 hypothetical protein [Bacteroidota bacterium]MDP4258895.1 hypothetical protein [Bacteroidota bacterium]
MTRRLVCVSLVGWLCIISSCAREYSLEQGLISSGALEKEINGDCSPIVVSGTYFSGQSLGDTNSVVVTISVSAKGRYFINSDTVNGYSFNGSGNFPDTGSFKVRLMAAGTPMQAGIDNFTVTYDAGSCQFSLNVLTNPSSPGPASYVLPGSPNSCMSDSLWGGYVKAFPLDTSNHIDIRVNVTTPGTYRILTDTVNGYSFSGSGTFTAAGVQTVRLAGSGTPQNQGVDLFAVHAGLSACSFSVRVKQVISVSNPDHFPLTPASYWNYDNLFPQGDTLGRQLVDTVTMNGNVYFIVQQREGNLAPRQYFFRKAGADYYEYGPVDKYTNSLAYTPQVLGDIHFLKENLTTGDSWISGEYSGAIQGGQTILLQYRFSCIDANATVVINGTAFSNVYKISVLPELKSVGGSYNGTGERYEIYYAKGVGLIYDRKSLQSYSQDVIQIRDWLVN